MHQAETEVCQEIWWLRSAYHVIFNEECVWCTEKHVLFKKSLQKGLTWVYTSVEMTVNGVEILWLSCKEKVPSLVVCEEGSFIVKFLEKGATYYQLCRQNSLYLLNDPHTIKTYQVLQCCPKISTPLTIFLIES